LYRKHWVCESNGKVSLPQKLKVSPFWFIRIFENKFPYIFVVDKASDFKFGKTLGFTKAHHKILHRRKVGVAMG